MPLRGSLSFFAALVFAASATANERPVCALKLADFRLPASAPGVTVNAGYGTIVNDGDQPFTITAFNSSAFAAVELHESRVEKGVASMRELLSLTIPPHSKMQLAPGAKHLMLIGARAPLKTGDKIRVAFTATTGCVANAELIVVDAR
jgi:periplasmic copper chaperone A